MVRTARGTNHHSFHGKGLSAQPTVLSVQRDKSFFRTAAGSDIPLDSKYAKLAPFFQQSAAG